MKKTCMNCAFFSGCLADESSGHHIHNFCFAWRTELTNLFKSEINTITNNLCDLTGKVCMYDDVETGDAYCYLFAPTNPYNKNVYFDSNKKENIKTMLSCIDELLEDYVDDVSPLSREMLLELKDKYTL